ncbi:MAG TPA: hypothetical protein VEO00_03975, partial [Actinomycetota bacterium]|nr:hypothetical protein [Actinomycetota bacterium]
RGDIARLYDADPFDLYATSEAGVVAWQCARRDAYHVNADAVVVEALGRDGAPVPVGETGEVALTVLWNRTTPFVRYRVGDLAALRPGFCGCGVALPLLSRPEGRTNDWVVRVDGGRVSPFRLTLGVLGPDLIAATRRYRIVQRAVNDFLLEVVWRDAPVPDLAERLGTVYARLLGGPVAVVVRTVDRLVVPPGSKYRLVESRVSRSA